MLAARLSSIPITTFVSGLGRQVTVRPPLYLKTQIVKSQNYATRVRPFRKIKQQLTLGERARAPAGDGGRYLKIDSISGNFSMERETYMKWNYIREVFNGKGKKCYNIMDYYPYRAFGGQNKIVYSRRFVRRAIFF